MREENCSAPYVVAMDAATAELDKLFEEAKRLRTRMEQVDAVINALKPLMPESDSALSANPELHPTKEQIDAALSAVLA